MCLGVCKWIVAFVFLYLIVIVLFVVLRGGIDCCGRATSPKGAILLQSPGREPWVNHCNTFIEPRRGGTSETIAECGLFLRKYWVVVEVLLKTRGAVSKCDTAPLL